MHKIKFIDTLRQRLTLEDSELVANYLEEKGVINLVYKYLEEAHGPDHYNIIRQLRSEKQELTKKIKSSETKIKRLQFVKNYYKRHNRRFGRQRKEIKQIN